MVNAGQPVQLGHLLQAVVGGADDLNLHVEVGGLLAEALVLHLGVRLGHAAVELVALHAGQMPIGEMVVVVDRVPLAREVRPRALLGLVPALGHRDVGEDDGRARRVPDASGDLAIALDVLGGLRPLVLHHHQHAEAELGHDLRGFRAHRRRVEAALGMRDRPRPDGGARDLEELAVPLEDLVGERLDHDLRRFHEARARLVHRDAEAGILHAGRPAAEAEETAAAAHDVEQRDLLGHAHGIVPREHDHGRAERDAPGPSRVVREQLRGRR